MSTDSSINLTESVVAGGNFSGGQRAKRCVDIPNDLHQKIWDGTLSEIDSDELTRYRRGHGMFGYPRTCNCPKPPSHKNRYQLGAREFTLTYSPKWFLDDMDARAAMRTSITKLMKYYKEDITQLRAVGEVGTNGLSHVHCFYKLNGGVKITDKNFKRAWKWWNPAKPLGRGFEGGHHASVREESDFLGYIDKDIEEAWMDINI